MDQTQDPLGLSPQQRRVSDLTEEFGPYLGALMALDPDFHVERACGYCREYGHEAGNCRNVIKGEWF